MIGFMEMENRNFRGHPARFNQLVVLKGAGRTETGRTDIPAPVTFNTLPKLSYPILETFFFRKFFNFIDV